MTQTIIDRIENSRIDKTRKIMLFCGIILILITTIKLLTGTGYWFEILFFGWAGISTLLIYKKLAARSGQFIDWKKDSIVFKLKGDTSPITIDKLSIIDISINLNLIQISEKVGSSYKLDISDFADFKTRARIKDNFEKQKNCA